MSEVNVKVEATNGELVIRKGEALPVKHPIHVVLAGNIDAPMVFAKARPGLVKSLANEGHVLVNMKSKAITLVMGESNPYLSYRISGKLKLSDQITSINLNGSKMFRSDLIHLIKRHRYYFIDKEQYNIILQSIEKFSAKIEKEIEQSSDKSGNMRSLLAYSTNWGQGLTNQFLVKMPIFDGHPDLTMRVEIGLDPTDASVKFYLESEDFHELVTAETEKIMGEIILWFEENTSFPVIFE